MATFERVTLSELESILHSLQLPSDTRVTVMLEDSRVEEVPAKRRRALAAMAELRGSGNGNLVEALLQARSEDVEL